MKSNISTKKFTPVQCLLAGNIAAGAIIFAMLAAAVLLNQKEIIFPEIAALVTGALISPKQAWEVSKFKFILLMTLSAGVGYAVSAFLPIPMLLKIFICLIFVALCLILSKSSLVPLISACILPLLMHTESIIYPISVFILAVLIAGTQFALEELGLREKRIHKPLKYNNTEQLIHWALLMVCIMLYSIYPVLSKHYLYIAPPLIVMFAEMMPPSSKLCGRETKIFSLTVICAVIGSQSRLLITEYFGLSLLLSGAVAILLVLLTMRLLGTFFPPSAALAFLPFIIARDALPYYIIYVSATTGIICILSLIITKLNKKK